MTVGLFDVAGSTVIVPQRVDPEQPIARSGSDEPPASLKTRGHYVDGSDDFVEAIQAAPAESQETLRRLVAWAISLEQEGLVRLGTFHGTANRWTLLPRLLADNVGLVTIWNDRGAYLQFWRSVFDRKAPETLAKIEQHLDPIKVGQGNTTKIIDPELLALLTEAYREASGTRPLLLT